MTAVEEAFAPNADAVLNALEVASRAPSIHNTQPWRWELTATSLRLRADRSRQLRVADPDGHSLLTSCGAALALTDFGLRAGGWVARIERMPDATDPDLLAVFSHAESTAPSPLDTDRAEAAVRRASDRRPFDPTPIDEQTMERLRSAGDAVGHGVHTHFPTRAEEKVNLAVAVSSADQSERSDPAYLAEMASWVRHNDDATDGIPTTAIPENVPSQPRRADVPVRDFAIGYSGREIIERDVDERPLIAVILSRNDSPLEQLQSGEAMMRLMIEAELLGVDSCALSQAVDWQAFRGRLQGLMGWQGYPQMMLRLGYPAKTSNSAPKTGRRPVSAVLDILRTTA